MNAEQQRLEETRKKAAPWKKWGPYLSERQWGTVREDYSDSMSAASYDRDGSELGSRGLFLDLPPWDYHVFDVSIV